MNNDSKNSVADSYERSQQAISFPSGFAGVICQYLYDAAPRPTEEAAITGALALLSGSCGRGFIVSNPPTGLNIYLALIMKSAIGKEAAMRAEWLNHHACEQMRRLLPMLPLQDVTHALARGMVNSNKKASGPGLVASLGAMPCQVQLFSELGVYLQSLLEAQPGTAMHSTKELMLDLYDKSGPDQIVGGIEYSKKEDNKAPVKGPAYSIAGVTTPETFYSVIALDAEGGFLSRWIGLERLSRERPRRNKNPVTIPNDDLLGPLCMMIWSGYNYQTNRQPVVPTLEAQAALDDFDGQCDDHINATDNNVERALWNRSHLRVLRIAGLLSLADHFEASWDAFKTTQAMPPSYIISEDHVLWAIDLERRHVASMNKRLELGDVGMGDHARTRKLAALVREYLAEVPAASYKISEKMRGVGVVPRSYLQVRVAQLAQFSKHRLGATKALVETIREFVDSGYFLEVDKGRAMVEYGIRAKCYLVVNLPAA